MNLELTLNEERSTALGQLVSEYNATRQTPVTEAVYLQTVLLGIIDERVSRNFQRRVQMLGEAAAPLPLPVRETLITLVESEISKHVNPE